MRCDPRPWDWSPHHPYNVTARVGRACSIVSRLSPGQSFTTVDAHDGPDRKLVACQEDTGARDVLGMADALEGQALGNRVQNLFGFSRRAQHWHGDDAIHPDVVLGES